MSRELWDKASAPAAAYQSALSPLGFAHIRKHTLKKSPIALPAILTRLSHHTGPLLSGASQSFRTRGWVSGVRCHPLPMVETVFTSAWILDISSSKNSETTYGIAI